MRVIIGFVAEATPRLIRRVVAIMGHVYGYRAMSFFSGRLRFVWCWHKREGNWVVQHFTLWTNIVVFKLRSKIQEEGSATWVRLLIFGGRRSLEARRVLPSTPEFPFFRLVSWTMYLFYWGVFCCFYQFVFLVCGVISALPCVLWGSRMSFRDGFRCLTESWGFRVCWMVEYGFWVDTHCVFVLALSGFSSFLCSWLKIAIGLV